MAKKWNADDTALIIREVQHPTMKNKQLAEKLGRSLQSIAAKKRAVEEQLKLQTKKKGEWSADEDKALLTTPFKSEEDLARELNRDKKDVHERREFLKKQRLKEKEQKAKELAEQAEKNKRVPLESFTTKLDITEMPAEQTLPLADANGVLEFMPTDSDVLKKKLIAIKAAVSMLRVQSAGLSEQALADFLLLADYILSDI